MITSEKMAIPDIAIDTARQSVCAGLIRKCAERLVNLENLTVITANSFISKTPKLYQWKK